MAATAAPNPAQYPFPSVSGFTAVPQSFPGTNQYTLSADQKSWVPFADPPFRYGAGGGFATLWNRPDYQKDVVPVQMGVGGLVA